MWGCPTWGSGGQCVGEAASQEEPRLPAARTAGADLNPLPESEGMGALGLSTAHQELPRLLGGAGQERSWPGCSCQGRRGPGEAANAGWGRRGQASWGRS